MIMKSFVFILSFLLLLPSTYAENIELKISAKWNSGHSTKTTESKVIAKLGKKWTIPFEGKDSLKINMIVDSLKPSTMNANIDPKKSISLNGKIYKMVNGKEKLVSSPNVIALLGKKAILKTKDENGDFLELTILPVKFSQK